MRERVEHIVGPLCLTSHGTCPSNLRKGYDSRTRLPFYMVLHVNTSVATSSNTALATVEPQPDTGEAQPEVITRDACVSDDVWHQSQEDIRKEKDLEAEYQRLKSMESQLEEETLRTPPRMISR